MLHLPHIHGAAPIRPSGQAANGAYHGGKGDDRVIMLYPNPFTTRNIPSFLVPVGHRQSFFYFQRVRHGYFTYFTESDR